MIDVSKASLPKAIFLMGPTASGKTALAIELRKVLPVELISVDSALIYRGMDIGTAKPDAEELRAAPHRLLDILDPAQAYSAADFRRDALAEMAEITAAGRIPLLVGGTMLYFKALLEGLSPLPSADPEVRAKIEQQAAEQGCHKIEQIFAHADLIENIAVDRLENNGEYPVHRKHGSNHRSAQVGFLTEPDRQQTNTGRPGKEIEKDKAADFVIFSSVGCRCAFHIILAGV